MSDKTPDTTAKTEPSGEKQPVAGSGMHGPAKKPGSKGDLYDGNFPPGVKPAEAADPGSETRSQDRKTDNRS